MKPCRKNRKQIVWLILDALSVDEAAELARHIEGCAGCRSYREEIMLVKQMVGSLEQATPPPATASAKARARIPAGSALVGFLAGMLRPQLWRLAIPTLAIICFVFLIVSALERQSVVTTLGPSSTGTAVVAATDLPPTLANYRAVASQSLDKLDDLLSRQAERPVTPGRSPTAGTLALQNLPD